jgi:hypothetical protein
MRPFRAETPPQGSSAVHGRSGHRDEALRMISGGQDRSRGQGASQRQKQVQVIVHVTSPGAAHCPLRRLADTASEGRCHGEKTDDPDGCIAEERSPWWLGIMFVGSGDPFHSESPAGRAAVGNAILAEGRNLS